MEQVRTLYGYWRSTAAYRVRIALRLKQLAHDSIVIDLRTGEQSGERFRALNPQGFVPFLVDRGEGLSQSLAIIEYLDETYPDPPLLPRNPVARAKVRALAQAVACDIHPINNLRVLNYLRGQLGLDAEQVNAWARSWIEPGFAALEAQAGETDGPYLAGNAVTLADICLVPQLYNARRVETDLSSYPALLAIEQALFMLPAFDESRPEKQPEALPA